MSAHMSTPSIWSICTVDFTRRESILVWWPTLISSVLSLFGSSFMLSSYFLIANTRKSWTSYFRANPNEGISGLVAFLALGDYLWAINVIVTYILLISENGVTYFTCILLRGWWQIAAGSTVCWTACIAFYLYLVIFNVGSVFRQSQKIWWIFHIFCWGLPTACYMILLGVQTIVKSKLGLCFPSEPWHFYLWFGPNTLVFVMTTVIYIVIFIKIRNKTTLNINTTHELPRLRVTLYLLVFVICWFLDIIAFLISYGTNCIPFGLTLIYSILLQLQGLFDALVYGFSNRELIRQYKDEKIYVIFLHILVSPVVLIPLMIHHIFMRCREIHTPPVNEKPEVSPLFD